MTADGEETKRRRRLAGEPAPISPPVAAPRFDEPGWVHDLLDDLEAIRDRSPAIRSPREKALYSLDAVVRWLRRHPGFADSVTDPLLLLSEALFDQDVRPHPILAPPRKKGRPKRSGTLDRRYRRNILVALHVLEASGLEHIPACKRVATILEKAGHHGVKRAGAGHELGFSWQTIEDWSAKALSGDMEGQDLRTCLDEVFGQPRREWPPSRQRAERVAMQIANDPWLIVLAERPPT